MKKWKLIIAIVLFFPLIVYNQTTIEDSYILSGTVVNGVNNQFLVGANLLTNDNLGTKTNGLGEFIITVHANDTIRISYIGFKAIHYVIPTHKNGKYLIKFKMYRDSVTLSEIAIFPWPTYKEFKKAFLTMDKQNEKIQMKGVKMYQDRNIAPWEFPPLSILTNPISFIYDKLLDKKAKLRRRLERKRKTIKKSIQIE